MLPTPLSRRSKFGTAALVSFALVAAACSGGSSTSDGSTSESSTSESSTSDGTDGTSAPEESESETSDAPVVSEGEIEEETIEDDSDPVAGGTLRYAVGDDVDGLNPVTSALGTSGMIMANAVFDSLAAYDADGVVVPYLAESIEPVDGDLSTWQVKLREGILFHDATPLDAEAVQVNFEAQRGSSIVGLAVRPFYPDEGATEVIDEFTLQYNLLEPWADFAATQTSQLGFVASPTWLAAAEADPTLNQEPVGSGPFKFESRSPDSITTFVRNDDWWNGDVYLDAVEIVPIPDPDTRNDLLFSGDVQAVQNSNPASVGDLQDSADIQNVIDENADEALAILNSAVPPFDDIRARQALTFATPLETYRSLIGLGIVQSADQMFLPDSIYYNPDVVQEGDMPDEAAALAAEYCAEHGTEENPILGTSTCSDGKINAEFLWRGPSVIQTRIAELLDEGWKSSFNITFKELAADETIQRLALGQYNVTTANQFGAQSPELDMVWIMCRTVDSISLNFPRYCDEERDAVILEAQATDDLNERVPLYQQVSQSLNDAYTYIFFTHSILDNAFAENVRGMCDRTGPDGNLLQCAVGGRTWFDSIWFAE